MGTFVYVSYFFQNKHFLRILTKMAVLIALNRHNSKPNKDKNGSLENLDKICGRVEMALQTQAVQVGSKMNSVAVTSNM